MRRTVEGAQCLSGVLFVGLFFVGELILCRWVPPPSPDDTAIQVAQMYRDNADRIRAGQFSCFLGTIFMLTFGAGLAGQLRRIRGVTSSTMYTQITSFGVSVVIMLVPISLWWTAAFRPETRGPDLTQLLNDLGWIMFVTTYPPFIVWCAATGHAILSDQQERPLFPRWAGYLSFFVAFAQTGASFVPWFKTGPFAWNGAFSFWVPLLDFFPWVVAMIALSFRATRRHDYDGEHSISVHADLRNTV